MDARFIIEPLVGRRRLVGLASPAGNVFRYFSTVADVLLRVLIKDTWHLVARAVVGECALHVVLVVGHHSVVAFTGRAFLISIADKVNLVLAAIRNSSTYRVMEQSADMKPGLLGQMGWR